ncbi:hypothetical protein QBC36DRAFT_123674, partial [Triangularia setosa]
MATRPRPPANPDTAQELVENVNQHPEDWIIYLRNMDTHATALEEEVAALRTAISTHDSTISSLRIQISNRDAIIDYQKEQLKERNLDTIQKISQLEVE